MSNSTAHLIWAAALIVAVPVTVVLVGEAVERLRQRDSPWAAAVALMRTWVLPLAVAYLVVRTLLDIDGEASAGRLVATALLVAAFVAALLLIRVAVATGKRRASAERRAAPPQLLLALPRVLLVLVAFWLLFRVVWGIELSGALTALGVTSLVISLALQQPLGSLASGLFLLSDQPFRPGEWIRVDDLEGRVIDINWRTTRIENRDGDLLVLPNATLATATIINYDQPSRLHRIVFPVQAAFSNPPQRVIDMLLTAARNTPGVLTDPAPDVKVVQVDDPLMGYEVQVWIDDYTCTPRVRSDLAALVWYWSERLEVPLPSPAQDLYLWDGPAAAAAKVMGVEELRRRLAESPMVGMLPSDALDLLATVARSELYARNETILDVSDERDELVVIHAGRAAMVVDRDDGKAATVAELSVGDVFGLLRRDHVLGVSPKVVALDDCEVVVIDGTTAATVIGRSPALAETMHQLAMARQRRVERLLTDDQQELS